MNNYQLTIKRKELLEAGAYDGRYRQRRVKDKKKEASRRWARERS